MPVTDAQHRPSSDAYAITAELATLFTGALRALDLPSASISLVENETVVHTHARNAPPEGVKHAALLTALHRHVARTDRTLVVDDATRGKQPFAPEETRRAVRALAAFPLHGPGGDHVGTLAVTDSAPHRWTSHDIAMLDMLARAATREVLLAHAFEREAEIRAHAAHLTLTLKENLMPSLLPSVPGLEVGASFQAAGAGIDLVGDFYDLIACGDGAWRFVVGDVCGKGVGAAKAATFARHIVRTHALQGLSLKHVIKSLNSTMYLHATDANAFLTAVYGEVTLDAKQCLVRLTAAGHPPPLIRRRDGSVREAPVRGMLLGVLPQIDLDECYVNLRQGDALIAFTDGVVAARSHDDCYGERRLRASLAALGRDASAQDIASGLLARILEAEHARAHDDIAILVLRRP